jgi:hypothetical protein
MNRNVLATAIEIVGVLFAAFGGFLGGIAPPGEADSRFAVGIASFLALIILLIIAAMAKGTERRHWIVVGAVFFVVSIGAAGWYWHDFRVYAFPFPPESVKSNEIAGTEMTASAATEKENGNLSNGQLLDTFGGREFKHDVWPEAAVNKACARLIMSYVLLVLSFATAIFALTEGALGGDSGALKRGDEAIATAPPHDVREYVEPAGSSDRVRPR